MNKKIFIIIFSLVLILGFLLRFYKLGTVLSGFPTDDAGLGYSAYSILKTGKDEFGKSFPVLIRSQGDFRTPVYTYLIIPFIKLFGLTVFGVRLPSAIFGFLTIPALYLLTLELTKNKYLSLLSALLLSISPWHMYFSRNAFDSNLALFFLVFGLYLLFKSLKNPVLMIYSAIIFGISIMAYRVEQIIVPLMLFIFFMKFRKDLLEKSKRKYLLASTAILIIICFPIIFLLNTPAYWVRANVLGIFTFAFQIQKMNFQYVIESLFLAINNAGYQSIRLIFEVYLINLTPRFINALGDYLAVPTYLELPAAFVWQLPIYLYGIAALIRDKEFNKLKFSAFVMILIFPIPASIARDPLSPMRSLQMLIPETLIISFGIYKLFLLAKKKMFRFTLSVIFMLAIVYSVINLYESFYILGNYYKQNLREWGWDKVSSSIKVLHTGLPVIVDNSQYGIWLQLAFFTKYDPATYQRENFEVSPSEYYTNLTKVNEKHMGNITVRQIDWEKDSKVKEYIVGNSSVISDEVIKLYKLDVVSEISFPDGTSAYKIVKPDTF